MTRRKLAAKRHSIFEIAKKVKEKKASSGQPDREVKSAAQANNSDKPDNVTDPSASQVPSPVTVETLQPVPDATSTPTRGDKKPNKQARQHMYP